MGIWSNLVEFDIERMKITKNFVTNDDVFQIEKINDEIFLAGEYYGLG